VFIGIGKTQFLVSPGNQKIHLGLSLGINYSFDTNQILGGFSPWLFSYEISTDASSTDISFASPLNGGVHMLEYKINSSEWFNVNNARAGMIVPLTLKTGENIFRVRFLQENGEWIVYSWKINRTS